MIPISFNYIADLPVGYEYKIFQTGNDIKIVGIAPDKKPIAFLVLNKHELKQIELEP